jgi:hypothetical protein
MAVISRFFIVLVISTMCMCVGRTAMGMLTVVM